MDSEDSRGGGTGDARSSSSSSSSSSRSRRSSSSDRSETSKKDAKSPPRSPPRSPTQSPPQSPPRSPSLQKSEGPRSPSPESRSQSPSPRSPSPAKPPHSPSNLSEAHSDINSPENSMPGSPSGPKSPDAPKSPSDQDSNIGSPERTSQYSAPPSAGEGPKTPQSPSSAPGSPSSRSRPLSPDSASQPISPPQRNPDRHSSSPSPDRATSTSPARSPQVSKKVWSPKEKWRRHTKAEQKMVPMMRERSRSESSQSSRSSSYNKRRSSTKDPATEEISDGEMESDQEDRKSQGKSTMSEKNEGKDLNITHEDLSDVSDLDSVGPEESDREQKKKLPPASTEMKQDVNLNGNNNASTQSSPKSDNGSAKVETQKLEKVPQEKTSNTEDGEEQLDFEAEEGECIEPKQTDQANGDAGAKGPELEDVNPGRRSRGSSLEEGEVSDEAERPEENEPRPVCRFFSRGACTWGVSCRFLHPGVTDKGNYNMFDVVRGMPAGAPYSAAPPRDTAPPESAWERGLRTAKEMLRIANKRKEQDMDFEEKKLHLSVGGVVHDPDAELAYAAAAVGASPPRLPHEIPHRDPEAFSRSYGPMYRGRYMRPVDERERYYEPERGYERERERERAYERTPHYEERGPVPDEAAYHKRRVRSSREVIVQRAEVERREGREAREPREGREGRDRGERGERGEREGRPRDGRGDEWADPWMRAEPAARRRRPPSSDESYSSTSSSNSSSRSSRSPSARRKRRASSSSRQRLSPSVIVRERRMATARATAMNPPAPRRRAPSPAAARQLSANPPPPASHRHKDELDPYGRNKASSRNKDRKKYSRSSSSGSESSSSSSESESESHSSSSSGSSGARRARHARLLNAAARPRLNAKASAGLAAAVSTVTSKKEIPSDKDMSGKKRAATSPVDSGPAKKSVSRREELLKQLKAVEDAIARKRSKI